MAASVRMNKLKETCRSKTKIIYISNSLHVCCHKWKKKKELSREMFSASQVRRLLEPIQSAHIFEK